MKGVTTILLILVKLYCAIKVGIWLFEYSLDKVNHPISEIQHILVFMVFDLWLIFSANYLDKQFRDD